MDNNWCPNAGKGGRHILLLKKIWWRWYSVCTNCGKKWRIKL